MGCVEQQYNLHFWICSCVYNGDLELVLDNGVQGQLEFRWHFKQDSIFWYDGNEKNGKIFILIYLDHLNNLNLKGHNQGGAQGHTP